MQTTFAIRMGFSLTLFGAIAIAEPDLIQQGQTALGRGDADAAIAIFNQAIAQDPASADAHYYLANAYGSKAQQGGMLAYSKYGPRMKEEYEKAVALDPKQVDARFGLLMIYISAPALFGGSKEKALEQAKAIKVIDPLLGHRAYASVYSKQKKPELAKQEYLDAIREQPASPKAHSFYGQYLGNVEEDHGAAFAEFEAALKIDPGYMPAFYHLGRTAALAETNFERGEEALKKYLEYTPTDKEPPLANAYYYLGAIYEKQGKKAEAKERYQAALRLNHTLENASKALKRLS